MAEWLTAPNHVHVARALWPSSTNPCPPSSALDGDPTTAWTAIGRSEAARSGIWEMTAGAMSDIEVAEVFVVLSGQATIEFLDEDRVLSIAAGDLVRLAAGARTIWRVDGPLRKLYITL